MAESAQFQLGAFLFSGLHGGLLLALALVGAPGGHGIKLWPAGWQRSRIGILDPQGDCDPVALSASGLIPALQDRVNQWRREVVLPRPVRHADARSIESRAHLQKSTSAQHNAVMCIRR